MRALLLMVAASLVGCCHGMHSLAQNRSVGGASGTSGVLLPEETTEEVMETGQLLDPDPSETGGDAEEGTRAQPGLSPPTLSPPRPPSLLSPTGQPAPSPPAPNPSRG
jgi:hypothetical protein